MKKLLFSFVLFFAAFYAADTFAKALCPDGITQEQCCALKYSYTLSNAQAVCSSGYTEGYYAGCYTCSSSSSAKVCPIGCSACSGARCTACESGFYKSGIFKSSITCKLCSTITVENGTCTACSSTGTCTAVSCNSGYTANGTTCEKIVCPANCSSCNVGGYCIQCDSGYTMSADRLSCIKPCSAGQYLSGSSCVNCPAGTYSAGGTVTSCTACASGAWSSAGASSCTACSSISVSNGTCTACSSTGTCTEVSCNSGYTANGTKCEKTVTCSGRTPEAMTQGDGSIKCSCTATSCGTGAKCAKHPAYNSKTKQNNYSVCVCQSGYYDNGESCSSCGNGCSECSDAGACTACENGYTLQDGECVVACDQYDVGNGTCTECDSSGCTDAECNGTNAYFDPTFRKCGVECDVNQYLDASYTCQDCPAGQTSTGGWLTTPTNCYSCASIPVDGGTCTECQDGVCTKARCENGYVLDASGTACIAARATCSSPLKISDDGCCCVK